MYIYYIEYDNEKEIQISSHSEMSALALLVPEAIILAEIEKLEVDYTSDETLKSLSKKFNVTILTLCERMHQLDFPKAKATQSHVIQP